MRRRTSAIGRYLPVGYLALSVALAAVLLPTALRPPPSQPPTSAELSPEAPPDEDSEIVLSELGRGTSGTAGSGPGAAGSAGDSKALPPSVQKPRKGRCFGDPPRQTESLYAAPCASAWTGTNNGGATYHGLTATEVHIGLIRDGAAAYEGPVDSAPAEQVDDVLRTYQVYERYLNESYELYGRKVRLYVASTDDTRSGDAKSAAIKLDDQWGMFAMVTADAQASLETIRRKLVLMGGYNNNQDFHERNSPYSYSFTIDGSKLVRFTAEYVCKQFWGRPVSFAGDPTFNGRPRKFGIIQYNDPAYYGYGAEFKAVFGRLCGGSVDEVQSYNWGDQGGDGLQIMTKFKAASVTSIIWMGEYLGQVVATAQGTSQAYYPEWIGSGGGGTDVNAATQLSDKAQTKNFVNITSLEMAMPRPERDYYRAYKSVDSDNEPDDVLWFYELQQLAGGIQLAGPALTPQAFREAMLRRWPRRPPEPVWTIGGGYAPGDYTYPDYVALEWWDNAAMDPTSERPGAWRHLYSGDRFTFGEIPSEPSPFFREGIERPPGEVQR